MREEAYGDLLDHWRTSYGGARIVNVALGTDLPESRQDIKKCRDMLYGFWSSFLFFQNLEN